MKPYTVFISDWRASHAALRLCMERWLACGKARAVRLMRDGTLYEVQP